MSANRREGWDVPVYHAIASPHALLIGGVPQTFFILNVLIGVVIFMIGQMLYGAIWWRVGVVCGGLHVGAIIGTAYEVQWLDMAWRYVRYGSFYEG